MELSWTRGIDGWTTPTLRVRTPDLDDQSLRLDARVWFAGASHTWSTSPQEVDAYDTVEVELTGLPDAILDDEQEDWLSDLSVQVVLLDADGGVLLRQAAPPLKVAWDVHGPLLLDLDEATELSVGGAWSEAAVDLAEASASADDSEFVTEYGRVDR